MEYVGGLLKIRFRDYAELFGLAGLIVAADQYTKWLVRANLDYMEAWSPWPWLAPYARILHTHNTGAAFGMLQQFGGVFMVLAMVVAVLILFYFPQVPRTDWPLRLAMIMQFSGAVGNLIDRLHQGYVTDFISVGSFAVFNIADACISMGVAVLIVGMLVKEYLDRRAASAEVNPEAPEVDIALPDRVGDAVEASHE